MQLILAGVHKKNFLIFRNIEDGFPEYQKV